MLGPMLEVMSGQHRGAILLLEQRRCFIGCSTSADLRLRDAGVVPQHAALSIERGHVRIEAIGADVDLGTGWLRRGNACYLKPPINLVLGEASVRLLQPGRTGPRDVQLLPSRLQVASRHIRTTTGIGIITAMALGLVGATAFSMRTGNMAANGPGTDQHAALSVAGTNLVATEKSAAPPRLEHVAHDVIAYLDAPGPDPRQAAVVEGRSASSWHADLPSQPSDRDSGDLRPRKLEVIQPSSGGYDNTAIDTQSSRELPHRWRYGRDADRGRASARRATQYLGYQTERDDEAAGPGRGGRDQRPREFVSGVESFLRSRFASRRYSGNWMIP